MARCAILSSWRESRSESASGVECALGLTFELRKVRYLIELRLYYTCIDPIECSLVSRPEVVFICRGVC